MSKFDSLAHRQVYTGHGNSSVVLLDTGAIITPEDVAMLQALYSRDPGSIFSHLVRVGKVGSGRFMDQYYVGYAHKSIGDCGTITLFIEDVSMLAAKAIQDWALYSGQECSTRYIDFSTQPFLNPFRNHESEKVLTAWRSLYLESIGQVQNHIIARFPIKESEKESTYLKAVAARSFDALRGILPAGASTNLSWHANLRQTADKLGYLHHHPLKEVRSIAQATEQLLQQAHPNSFSKKKYEASETYRANWMRQGYYLRNTRNMPDFRLAHVGIDFELMPQYFDLFDSRPPKTELPRQVAELGSIRFEFPLDFGSFRDIQRHRAVAQRMPLLTPELGFEPWYLDEMPPEVRIKTENTLGAFEGFYEEALGAGASAEELQYLTPMGYLVPNSISGDLAAQVYLAELRATPMVHPTLQLRASQMAGALEETFGPWGLKIHADAAEIGRFDVRRGTQDIVTKE